MAGTYKLSLTAEEIDERLRKMSDFANVFGVCWDGSESTALTRLTPENDPYDLVTVEITEEPEPAVDTSGGSSPFDNYAPWKGMKEFNVSGNNIIYSQSDEGFSRTENDTVVYIPEFYVRVIENEGTMYYYISDNPLDGFVKHPGSGNYVARYNTGAGYVSKSETMPLTNMTRGESRTNSMKKGANWSQYDYSTWNAVQMLYLIEFADWDSQRKIGLGNVLNEDSVTGVQANGGTDSMSYHTGRTTADDGFTQVQYRHIENMWGNVCEWVDGINLKEREVFICTNHLNYADDTEENYVSSGVSLPETGHIGGVGFSPKYPWAFLPDESIATTDYSTPMYIPDKVCSGTGWRILYTSNNAAGEMLAGMFRFSTSSASDRRHESYGARMVYHGQLEDHDILGSIAELKAKKPTVYGYHDIGTKAFFLDAVKEISKTDERERQYLIDGYKIAFITYMSTDADGVKHYYGQVTQLSNCTKYYATDLTANMTEDEITYDTYSTVPTESWTFTLEDGSTVTKAVGVV